MKRKLAVKRDPLIVAARNAYRSSEVYKIDKLLAEQAKWKRRQTIADNKLAELRKRIDELAKELAQKTVKPEAQ